MRGALAVLGIGLAVVSGLAVQATEKPTAEYQQAMKEMDPAYQKLRADVKTLNEAETMAPDYSWIEKDAVTLKALFATTVAFWTAKTVDDALKVAQAGAKGLADLEKALKDQDIDGIDKAATAIGATCATCHAAHREQLPDGTYEIK